MSERHPDLEGAQFLHQQDSKLHASPEVLFEQAQREKRAAKTEEGIYVNRLSEVHSKPADKIDDWLDVIRQTHRVGDTDPRVLDRIKNSYHKKYVINPDDVPESAFLLEQRIAREQGHGDIPITDEFKEQKTATIIANQEASLDKWVDYLTSDDAMYPMWAKYWAFTAVTKMGKFEKKIEVDEEGQETETARFAKRTADTIAPFPPLNARAVAAAIEVMEERIKQKALPKADRTSPDNASNKLTPQEFQHLLSSENFSKLYTQFLIELPEYSLEGLKETRGNWKVYPQGSDPRPLSDSLEGHPLEWCTASVDTAREQLEGGDFHVYYSLDSAGDSTIPRVAIRMEDDRIAEVRGIAPGQNLDPYIGEVVSDKMEEFPDGARYQKCAADMQKLTSIEAELANGQEPSIEVLKFLYELDGKIEGFGYGEDPRVLELLKGRDMADDLLKIFDCEPSQIGLFLDYDDDRYNDFYMFESEALNGTPERPILFYTGDLIIQGDTYRFTDKPLVLPRYIDGDLTLSDFDTFDNIEFPEGINGNLRLYGSAADAVLKNVSLPKNINKSFTIGSSIKSIESVKLPQTIAGDLIIDAMVTHLPEVIPPEYVGGKLVGRSTLNRQALEGFPRGVPYVDADEERAKQREEDERIHEELLQADVDAYYDYLDEQEEGQATE